MMDWPCLVIPPDEALLKRMQGRQVAVRLTDASRISEVTVTLRDAGSSLDCILWESGDSLDEIVLDKAWANIPIALFVTQIGRYCAISHKIDLLRRLDLRIHVPATLAENITGVRLLSSLGVPTCIDFRYSAIDYDALADLATYAVLERFPHAPIDPFSDLAEHYQPSEYANWGDAFFDDPRHYLYIDTHGRGALSYRELLAECFFTNDILNLDNLEQNTAYRERLDQWKQYFLTNHECARCPAWRICLGQLERWNKNPLRCSGFFQELMDVLDINLKLNSSFAQSESKKWLQSLQK